MASTPGEAAFAEAAAMVTAGNLAGAEARLRQCLAVQPDHQNAGREQLKCRDPEGLAYTELLARYSS